MTSPLILLSPDESRDQDGPVTPDTTGVTVIPGQHANAWECVSGLVFIAYADHLPTQRGTMLVRFQAYAAGSGIRYLASVGSTGAAGGEFMAAQMFSTPTQIRAAWRHGSDPLSVNQDDPVAMDTWDTFVHPQSWLSAHRPPAGWKGIAP